MVLGKTLGCPGGQNDSVASVVYIEHPLIWSQCAPRVPRRVNRSLQSRRILAIKRQRELCERVKQLADAWIEAVHTYKAGQPEQRVKHWHDSLAFKLDVVAMVICQQPCPLERGHYLRQVTSLMDLELPQGKWLAWLRSIN